MRDLVAKNKLTHVRKYYVPLVSGVIFLLLFWLIASFIYRDTNLLGYWCAAGFLFGVANGFAIKALQANLKFLQHTTHKKSLITAILLAEFALGLLLIGPNIWVQSRFIPTSNIHSICCETPLEYGAAKFDHVNLKTNDGATIAGWYVEPTSQYGKVIILIHGYGYDRRGTDFHAYFDCGRLRCSSL